MSHSASPLESSLLAAVREAGFDQVIDFGPAMEDREIPPGSARRITHMPHVDVAVIQLDRHGQAMASANVLLSRDYPQGIIVPVDPQRGAWQVRFQSWNIDRWNGGRFHPGQSSPYEPIPWQLPPSMRAAELLNAEQTDANIDFMSPYPASLFKLLIAFHAFQRVDRKEILPDAAIEWMDSSGSRETQPLKRWIELMITLSDNRSTQVLIRWLHREGQMERLNRTFKDLGLSTLQIHGTRAADGGGWQPGQIHMTAYDTARLLWLIDGGPSTFWKTPAGMIINRRVLSDSSRASLKQFLQDQAFHEILSTSLLTGHPHVRPGIPARVPPRWIDPSQGTVTLEGVPFGINIREPNTKAEVLFAHKTGLTYNYASDAGIVESLPGQPWRRYIIAFFSNLGYRYADEIHRDRKKGPYSDPVSPIACTQRIPALGRSIDAAMIRYSPR